MKRERYPTRKIRLVGVTQLLNLQLLLSKLPLDPDRPLVVTIAEEVKSRKLDQNALMWVGPLKDISEQVYMKGRSYSDKVWHEYFKTEFLPESFDPELTKENYIKWSHYPDGDMVLTGSTTDLTVKGFALYLEQVYAFGAKRGVEFSGARI